MRRQQRPLPGGGVPYQRRSHESAAGTLSASGTPNRVRGFTHLSAALPELGHPATALREFPPCRCRASPSGASPSGSRRWSWRASDPVRQSHPRLHADSAPALVATAHRRPRKACICSPPEIRVNARSAARAGVEVPSPHMDAPPAPRTRHPEDRAYGTQGASDVLVGHPRGSRLGGMPASPRRGTRASCDAGRPGSPSHG